MVAYAAIVDSPLGALGVCLDGDRLNRLDFLDAPARFVSSAAADAARALGDWFDGRCDYFDLPLALAGSPFQRRVWAALQRIPFGTTLSYGELADRLESAPRAIGAACRANPLPVVVPCHRVIATTGLGGYSGAIAGPVFERKRWLLAFEAARQPFALTP